MLSGVPQGSYLGPLLFSLFMNDLPNIINFANILMYADDIKAFLSFNNFIEHVLLQCDLNDFFLWCKYNIMEPNIKKWRNNFIAVNYLLGILLDTKLKFNDHISLFVSKARSTFGLVKRWANKFFDSFITK